MTLAGKDVAIAGAGIGGLTAALCLAGSGARVTILERAARLGEVGAGLQMSPNAMKVMAALGLEESLIGSGFEPERAVLRHHSTGFRTLTVPLKGAMQRRYGTRYLGVHRADLQAVLLGAAVQAGVELHLATPVGGYAFDGGGVRLPALPQRRFDLLIGADGIRSAVSTQMLGPERARFTGHVAWRATRPMAQLARPIPPDATVWAGPGGHLVTYPLRGGALANIIAVEERHEWVAESWTEERDAAALRERFADWHPIVTQILAGLDRAALWGLFDRPPLERWSDGPVVLLGDACHPTLPFMAQGAAMAIEDAWILTRAIEAHGISRGPAVYEALRKPRATWLQSRARRNAGIFHLTEGRGLVGRAKLFGATLIPPALAGRMFDRIYGYDPISVGKDI